MARNELVDTTPPPAPEDLWDENHPRSIISLLPRIVGDNLKLARKKMPSLFEMDERDLLKHLSFNGLVPSQTDNKLRMRFWNAVDDAYELGKSAINMSQVVAGICQPNYFWNKYLKSPSKVAWLLCRPLNFDIALRETLNFSTMRLRQILEVDPVDKNGKVDVKLAYLQMKIHQMVEMRLHGTAIQRTENKTLSVNVTSSDKQIAQMAVEGTQDALTRRIAELKIREQQALNVPVENKKVTDAEIV